MPTDPMFPNPTADMMASPTALMYINLILAGTLLLEGLLLWALLVHWRVSRLPALLWLALPGMALSLAHEMWSTYAKGSELPRFPPPWFGMLGGAPPLLKLLMLPLVVVAGITPLLLFIAAFLPPSSSDSLIGDPLDWERSRHGFLSSPPRHDSE